MVQTLGIVLIFAVVVVSSASEVSVGSLVDDEDQSLEEVLDTQMFKVMVEAVRESMKTSMGEMDMKSQADMETAIRRLVVALRRIEELQEKKREEKKLAEVLTSEKIPIYMMFRSQSRSKHL